MKPGKPLSPKLIKLIDTVDAQDLHDLILMVLVAHYNREANRIYEILENVPPEDALYRNWAAIKNRYPIDREVDSAVGFLTETIAAALDGGDAPLLI